MVWHGRYAAGCLALALGLILGAFWPGAARSQSLNSLSYSINRIQYSDGANRNIDYQFNGGVVNSSGVLPVPGGAIISRPAGESYTWVRDNGCTTRVAGGAYQVAHNALPDMSDEDIDTEIELRVSGGSGAVARTFNWSAVLSVFRNLRQGYGYQFRLANDIVGERYGDGRPFYQPNLSLILLPGQWRYRDEETGEVYSGTNSLLVHTNVQVTLLDREWYSTNPPILNNLNLNQLVMEGRLSVRQGNAVTFSYRINNGAWRTAWQSSNGGWDIRALRAARVKVSSLVFPLN